jgi:ankyrin repeat protein
LHFQARPGNVREPMRAAPGSADSESTLTHIHYAGFSPAPDTSGSSGHANRRKALSSKTLTSLDQFRKDARRLKKAIASGDHAALARAHKYVSADKPLKHADCLHVIAREAGQDSWPQLKFAVESAAMTRSERAERLKTALFAGQHWITAKLLGDDPALSDENLGLQIALYDLGSVRDAIEADPQKALTPIGVRTPLLHLAFSKEIHRSPSKHADMLALAELLLSHGADVNNGFPADANTDHKLSALYGALCHADNYELGEFLLRYGAYPNDNESLYHATELAHTRALKLLLQFGAKPDGTNALPRALDFNDLNKVRMLLEAGANPNLLEDNHPSGQPMNTIPALHQAARRGCSGEVVSLLVSSGAELDAQWQGHSAYALARIHGHEEAARSLSDLGCNTNLTPDEQALAACATGEVPSKSLDLEALTEEDRRLLVRLASEPGRLPQIKALIAAGLDPNDNDEMGLSPLHAAGWHGLPEKTAYFLSLKPDLSRKNGFGGDALDTVLHGAEFAPEKPGADHVHCARLLLENGSRIYPDHIKGCGDEEMAAFLETWISAHPESLDHRT